MLIQLHIFRNYPQFDFLAVQMSASWESQSKRLIFRVEIFTTVHLDTSPKICRLFEFKFQFRGHSGSKFKVNFKWPNFGSHWRLWRQIFEKVCHQRSSEVRNPIRSNFYFINYIYLLQRCQFDSCILFIYIKILRRLRNKSLRLVCLRMPTDSTMRIQIFQEARCSSSK